MAILLLMIFVFNTCSKEEGNSAPTISTVTVNRPNGPVNGMSAVTVTDGNGGFVGCYGSGGPGSASLTEFHIPDGKTKNFNVKMWIY